MARYEHLAIFISSYSLCLDIYKVTRNFDREYKHTLGERLKQSSHDIMNGIIVANSCPDTQKAEKIQEILDIIENMRIYMRLACDLKICTPAVLGRIGTRIEDVARQSSGWKKWTK